MAPLLFATEILADGPVGFWRLGETVGSAVAGDSSGLGHDGTYSVAGITLEQPGLNGGDTAALFDGAAGRIIVPNAPRLNPTRITMEATIRWDGPNGQAQRILEKESFPGMTQYGLSIVPDGRVAVQLRMREPANRMVNAYSTGVVALGVETHIAATYDGQAIQIYLNGDLDSVTKVNTNPVDIDVKHGDDPSIALAIGNRMGPPLPPAAHGVAFNGVIDEVALFDKALTAERIRTHYQGQFKKTGRLQYAVTFVCGASTGTVVARGTYFTAVNVHNPTSETIRVHIKIAVALPTVTAGPVSAVVTAELGSDGALEIDRADIVKHAKTKDGFLKGFVVIESDVEVDVVAVYTAAGKDEHVATLHTQRVLPRRL